MNLIAMEKKTGRVLLSQQGNLTETAFRSTVLSLNPSIDPNDVIVICDGSMTSLSGPVSQQTAPKSHSVVWKGSFTDLGGYANMNRELTLRLGHHGLTVKADVLPTGPQVDPHTNAMIRVMASTRFKDENSCPMVIGFTPMPVKGSRRAVVFYTMMETQGLHKEFVNRCNSYATEVWVPCQFYADVFKKCGVARPIKLMPLGVNHDIYVPGAVEPLSIYERMPDGERIQVLPKRFRFMSLFGWSYRKGADILCRSFLKEFSADDNCALVIHSRSAKADIRTEIRSYYEEALKYNKALPDIYHCGEATPIQDLPGMYAASNCFVFCSRGEGFGLPVVEAGACGVPVISAYNTAMTQYLDEDCAELVEPESFCPANDKLTWITEFYRDQDFSFYGEESVEKFGKLMRKVMENPEQAIQKAANFRDKILNEYTWDIAARRVAKRLKEMK